ncbi:MAG: TIGR03000 domain-containing protein, partial [Planctomycetota bacterium]|nr:TIGR03000 domain-containing protein [Planctomycetota bacterium]
TSTETKVVYVGAGQQSRLAFNFAAPPAGDGVEQPEERVVSQPDEVDEAPKTTLRLRVPATATVTLAGSATKSTGGDRVFTTRRLAVGQTWDNYVIRAELERDGRRLTKEVSIRLQAGETRDLAIDFDSADVTTVASAARR